MNNSSEVRQTSDFSSRPTSGEWTKMATSVQGAVILEGVAAGHRVGPLIGRYDIYVCEDAYMFRISLPGVDLNKESFGVAVKPTGEITIRGETYRGKLYDIFAPEKINVVLNMLPDAGPFSVRFNLPGPVRSGTMSSYSSGDGYFWGIIYKL